MKTIFSFRRHHYMTRFSIFLIMVALIAGTLSCSGTTPPRYDLTMAVNPVEGGTATDETGESPYQEDTDVSIKAVANTGYHFVGWSAPAGTFANENAAETTFVMPDQDVTVTANFAEEIQTEIQDWYDLHAVRDNMGGNYTLMNDLDSTTPGYEELASPTANEGNGWQPIGNEEFPFAGSFNGKGYEIRDLRINHPDESSVGLFSRISGAGVIENIGVVNADVTGYEYVGSLVGYSSGTVSNSYATGNVSGHEDVGGLVGQLYWGTVSKCYATSKVTGAGFLGGLVGSNSYGTLSQCYATSKVTGAGFLGGLVGLNSYGTLSHCYAIGDVAGISMVVGGLVGWTYDGTLSECYARGSVTGWTDVGGLVAWNFDSTVSNSFWDTETSGQATSDGGTGKNTTEMKDIVTFTDTETEGLDEPWDMTTVANPGTRNPSYIWNIVDDETYPFLSWQPVS